MAVPKSKKSKSRRNMRRSHLQSQVFKPALSKCSQCGEVKQAHRVCTQCGSYKGKEVVAIDDFV